jgi:hypothetical protein
MIFHRIAELNSSRTNPTVFLIININQSFLLLSFSLELLARSLDAMALLLIFVVCLEPDGQQPTAAAAAATATATATEPEGGERGRTQPHQQSSPPATAALS